MSALMPRTLCSRSRRLSETMGMPKAKDLPEPVPVATTTLADFGFRIADCEWEAPRMRRMASDWCL